MLPGSRGPGAGARRGSAACRAAAVSNYKFIAAVLTAISGWGDDKLAAGQPAKWVCHELIRLTRYAATLARYAGEGGELDQMPEALVFPEDPAPGRD
jgi:hypothetical protein